MNVYLLYFLNAITEVLINTTLIKCLNYTIKFRGYKRPNIKISSVNHLKFEPGVFRTWLYSPHCLNLVCSYKIALHSASKRFLNLNLTYLIVDCGTFDKIRQYGQGKIKE